MFYSARAMFFTTKKTQLGQKVPSSPARALLAPGDQRQILPLASSRRVFIGYLIFAKAAEAGGDRMTPRVGHL
jgi:hypothetical protein